MWLRLAADALDGGAAVPASQVAVLLRAVADLSDPMLDVTSGKVASVERAAYQVAVSILGP